MTIDITCPNCNFTQKIPEETIPEEIKLVKCPRCNGTFDFTPEEDNQGETPGDGLFDTENNSINSPNETDDPEYFTDLWKTFSSVLFSPTTFFREKRKSEGLKNSVAFGMLLGSLGAMFGFFWQFLLKSDDLSLIINILPVSMSLNKIFIILIIISPILVLLNMFIVAGVLHLCLIIFRGANNDFEATIKVTAYTNAVNIFSIIPYIGSYIGVVWGIVALVIGLKEIHETSTLKSVFALLLPFFILFGIGIVVAIIFISRLI